MKRYCGLVLTVLLILPAKAGELLKNSDFSGKKAEPWELKVREGYGHEAEVVMEAPGVARVRLGAKVSHPYVVLQQKYDFEPGRRYKVVVEVKPTGEERVMRITANWNRKKGGWTDAGLAERIRLTEDWTVAEFVFTATEKPEDGFGILALQLGGLDKDLLVRKVSLTLVE